jgi:hypothetical protein
MLRDLMIVWGVVNDTPELKAERELHRTDVELLEAEGMAEEFCAKAELLRARIRRLSVRRSEGDRLDRRIARDVAKARLALLEIEARAEEMCAKVSMLSERADRLRPLVQEENARWATA